MKISTKDYIWNVIIEKAKALINENTKLNIIMYTDSEKLFKDNFDFYVGMVKNNFMQHSIDDLDRHKISAIIICSVLHNDVLGISVKDKAVFQEEKNVFLGNEKLAVNVALSYMYKELKKDIKSEKVPYDTLFPHYILPKPYSCDRDYDLVLCRDLYYAKKFFSLNPLSLANLLFLIEEYSFTSYSIERSDYQTT